ncbi:MAG: hypothetical protein K0R18_178 [Bacillales bacterium]|nr:hypothetical protein [Bacillales bacterium]
MKEKDDQKHVVMTEHGEQRIKDRLGLSKKTADKTAQKALDFGVSHSETKGSLKKLIDGLYLREKKANNIKIYNRNIYLFKDVVLITVINLPNRYSAAADKLQKNKNKDMQEVN